jgi:hypothetical protein
MENIKPIFKKLTEKHFKDDEKIVDRFGNIFIKKEAVAEILGTSLTALQTTFKKRGLKPIDRYLNGFKPYFLEDVEKAYNQREK